MGIISDPATVAIVLALPVTESRTASWGVTVSLVEDYEDMDWLVIDGREAGSDPLVTSYEHIDINADGYYQPARKCYEVMANAIADHEAGLWD